ncbi:ATP-binding protein [Enterobacteriaceae bacterium H18W14]|uniref:sensor histidine kinase n=1 Tax=Dryocola boscaweniae TaxID=2925397 RepID=UPI0022F13530|nr:ATP-binding protein [Dryocola boscaweniae]MCT4715470.1 ATP-binding protein [Dryocola boscaweniae]
MPLERYAKELKESHVAMTHALRSPLTAAIGRLQGMIDGVFEPDEAQLKMVMRQLNELSRLVEDFHFLKLADAGQLSLSLLPTSLNEIVREKVAWINPSALKVGVRITHHEDRSTECLADPYRIGQVFLILMDNTLRYAADGGVLDISYETAEEEISILFKDKGPAVADSLLEDLFTPFMREKVSQSRHSGDSGLGLSIARAICHAHGGTIRVDKNLNGGLTFRVTLRRC